MRFWRNVKVMRVARATTFVLATLPLPGCIVWDGSGGSSGGHTSGSGGSGGDMSGGPAPMACPRAPDLGGTTPPMLSADELVRANELCQWKSALYDAQGWSVLYTVQMPSGDMYDYIDMSGVPDAQDQPPSPPALALPPGFDFVQTELGLHPELAVGPKGTQLRVRPDFSGYITGYTGATSVDQFIKMTQVPGTPTGGGRLFAGISSTNDGVNKPTYNEGAAAWVMPYAGPIEPGTMSLLEMAVGCRDGQTMQMYQQIGIAASRDYADPRFQTTNDSVLRLQVEFYKASADLTGEGNGGWAGTVSMHDFQPYPQRDNPMAPGMILYPSTVGGPQLASHFEIQHSDALKKWYVAFNGIWIGWYEDSLFNDALISGACEALWYMETYNPGYDPALKKAAPKWPPGGSGHFAADGLGYASFFAAPEYFDTSMTPQWPDKGGTTGPSNPNCYTTTGLINLLPPFDHVVFVGGPGGDAPNNACPAPAPPAPQDAGSDG